MKKCFSCNHEFDETEQALELKIIHHNEIKQDRFFCSGICVTLDEFNFAEAIARDMNETHVAVMIMLAGVAFVEILKEHEKEITQKIQDRRQKLEVKDLERLFKRKEI